MGFFSQCEHDCRKRVNKINVEITGYGKLSLLNIFVGGGDFCHIPKSMSRYETQRGSDIDSEITEFQLKI